MHESKLPKIDLGTWIRRADEVLTARIEEAQALRGLSHRDSQVLDALATRAGPDRRFELLRPRVDPAGLDASLRRLVERGLVAGDGTEAGYRLTDRGRRVHEAHVLRQNKVQHRAFVSEAEYATTLRVLQRLVENLSDGDVA